MYFLKFAWESKMTKFRAPLFVAVVLCLAAPALAATNSQPSGKVDLPSTMQKNDQIKVAADKHLCRSYGRANNCKAKYDSGSKECKCIGK
jgi:hypothetical protein